MLSAAIRRRVLAPTHSALRQGLPSIARYYASFPSHQVVKMPALSPTMTAGNIGAFEAALMNTKVERPEEPVEILRTLHSFDPCLACSTHVMSPDGQELAKVKVR